MAGGTQAAPLSLTQAAAAETEADAAYAAASTHACASVRLKTGALVLYLHSLSPCPCQPLFVPLFCRLPPRPPPPTPSAWLLAPPKLSTKWRHFTTLVASNGLTSFDALPDLTRHTAANARLAYNFARHGNTVRHTTALRHYTEPKETANGVVGDGAGEETESETEAPRRGVEVSQD